MSNTNYEPQFPYEVEWMCEPLSSGETAWHTYREQRQSPHPLDFVKDVNCIALRVIGLLGGRATWITYDTTRGGFVVERKTRGVTDETLYDRHDDETFLTSYIESGLWWPWDYSVAYPTPLSNVVERNKIQSEQYDVKRPTHGKQFTKANDE